MSNYVIYHLHTDLSNGTTILDSVNKYTQYVDRAKELGMKAMAFSEHGNIFEWLHKKEYIEKCGMKYIHGIEMYVTLGEKERDNFHVGLYSKNYQGFLELNRLSSLAFERDGVHFYFSPRITLDELLNTSENIIVTTACLGGILNNGDEDTKGKFIQFLSRNNHRCFLEIQHHNVKEQADYNMDLWYLSEQYNIPLIAGTDTHALDDEYMVGRSILQSRKGIHFDNEDGWDMTFKTYDQLVSAYELQDRLPLDVYLQAIENTNLFADMVEEFSLDTSFKYPKLYDDPEHKINELLDKYRVEKKLDDKDNVFEYDERIEYELEVYKSQNAIDFLLLEEDIKSAMRAEGRYCGYSRGSVSGSSVAWLLGITDVDSIKYKLYFERFMNPARVSLADVDTDWSTEDRDRVKEYIHKDMKEKGFNIYTAEIITFNTIALKGAIKDVAGGLRDMSEYKLFKIGYPKSQIPTLEEANEITKNIEAKEDVYRKKYPKLFEYVDMLSGVIVSVGTHPAGTVVSPISLEETIGTFRLNTSPYPITQLNMKEVDSLNYVKLDVLGLDNVGIINNACGLAGIDRLTPDNMDFEDDAVWDNICKSPMGIFQFEADFAHSMLKRTLSEDVMEKVLRKNPNASRLDLMSMANGAIRPAGESYRDALANGDFADNGHPALNEAFASTNNYLVFQESLIYFLSKFCGYSFGEADIVRRGFAKKTGTEKFIPKIKEGFARTMASDYDMKKEDSDKLIDSFVRVIEDASDYLFSLNHSTPYSMIGYATGYLRTYYPLEFLTAVLEINENNQEKTSKAIEYMNKFTDIKLSPAKFRRSRGGYLPNKEDNTIYKGIGSIKGLNSTIGDDLYELKDIKYETFFDLLDDIDVYCSLNSAQLETLIKLDFFSEFGHPKYLIKLVEIKNMFDKSKVIGKGKYPEHEHIISRYSTQTEKQFRNLDNAKIIQDVCDGIDKSDRYSISELSQFQMEYMGYTSLQFDIDKRYHIIKSIDAKFTPKLEVQSLGSGETFIGKVNKKTWDKSLKVGDIIYIQRRAEEFAWKKTEDGFERDESRKEWHIKGYSTVQDWELEEIIYG